MRRSQRRRPSARLLVVDASGRVLLFRFAFTRGALAGSTYWATPGGKVEPGETFEDTARRELFEETGITAGALRDLGLEREFVFPLSGGERVLAAERYFVARVPDGSEVSHAHWTEMEREVMVDEYWWSREELTGTAEQFFPEDLPAMLAGLTPPADNADGSPRFDT